MRLEQESAHEIHPAARAETTRTEVRGDVRARARSGVRSHAARCGRTGWHCGSLGWHLGDRGSRPPADAVAAGARAAALHGQHQVSGACPRRPSPPPPGQTFAPPPFIHFTNQTLRQIVHASIGGSKARVVLSNAYGTAPVTIGGAHLALRDKQGAIQAASGRPLTFSGKPTMTIPANAVIYSDPVNLTVPPMSDLAIDLYLPGTTNAPSTLTMHGGALQTSYISETGNHVGKTDDAGGRDEHRAGSCSHGWTWLRPTQPAPSSPSATRSRTGRARRRTRTAAGPTNWQGGCRRKGSRWAC